MTDGGPTREGWGGTHLGARPCPVQIKRASGRRARCVSSISLRETLEDSLAGIESSLVSNPTIQRARRSKTEPTTESSKVAMKTPSAWAWPLRVAHPGISPGAARGLGVASGVGGRVAWLVFSRARVPTPLCAEERKQHTFAGRSKLACGAEIVVVARGSASHRASATFLITPRGGAPRGASA